MNRVEVRRSVQQRKFRIRAFGDYPILAARPPRRRVMSEHGDIVLRQMNVRFQKINFRTDRRHKGFQRVLRRHRRIPPVAGHAVVPE